MGGPTQAFGFLRRQTEIPTAHTYRRSWLRLEADRNGIQTDDVVGVLRAEIIGEAQEVLLIAALDPIGNVRQVVEVGRGDYHSVTAPLAPMLAVPLLAGCNKAVIAHNHPSGRLYPSKHDYALTKAVSEGLLAVGVVLDDHIIYGPDGKHLSLREAHTLEVPEPRIVEVQA